MPFELPPNSQAQALISVQSGLQTVFSAPQTVTVATVQPSIFTTASSGKGQGVIFNYPANQLVNSSAPAKAGEVVVVYCTGLGLTNPSPPASGFATPAGQYDVVNKVTATVGGINAPVQFAGLVPSLVGLYQVNVQIPPGVAANNTATLQLTQNGVTSNMVTLAITDR